MGKSPDFGTVMLGVSIGIMLFFSMNILISAIVVKTIAGKWPHQDKKAAAFFKGYPR